MPETARQSLPARAVVVKLSPLLVDLFPGSARRVEMQAESVAAMVRELDRRWPGMGDRICDSRPAIRKHMNIFVDGERASLETAIAPGAEVFVLTAISGG